MADPIQYEDGGPDTSVSAPARLTGPAPASVLSDGAPAATGSVSRDSAIPGFDPQGAVSDISAAASRKLGNDNYIRTEFDSRIKQDRERMNRALSVETATANDPALTHPWNADQERAERIKGPLENFGSFASIFALAASAFTKTPMNSALNAAGAAMTAMHQNDELAYKSAYQAWKDNTELVQKRFNMERAVYDDATKLASTDLATATHKLAIGAAQFNDKKIAIMAEHGMISEIFQTLDARANAMEKLQKYKQDLENFTLTADIGKDKFEKWKTEHPAPAGFDQWMKLPPGSAPPPGSASAKELVQYGADMRAAEHQTLLEAKKQVYDSQHSTYGAGGMTASKDQAARIFERAKQLQESGEEPDAAKAHARAAAEVQKADSEARSQGTKEGKKVDTTLTKEGIDLRANMFIKGNPAATTNVGRGVQGSANLDAITNRVSEILKEKGISAEEAATLINENTAGFMGDKRGATVLAQRSAQVVGASTVALNTMDRVLDASKKVSRTEYSDINKILLAGRERTGNKEVIEYGIALNTLVNNYARAIGAGNNALTNTARQEAHDNLQKYWSQGQIEVAVKQMKKELHDELKGAQEARKIWQEGGTPFPEEKDAPRLKVKTPEEAQSLAPGTKYETPDGKPYTR